MKFYLTLLIALVSLGYSFFLIQENEALKESFTAAQDNAATWEKKALDAKAVTDDAATTIKHLRTLNEGFQSELDAAHAEIAAITENNRANQSPVPGASEKKPAITMATTPPEPKPDQLKIANLRAQIATAQNQIAGFNATADRIAAALDAKEKEWKEWDRTKKGITESATDRAKMRGNAQQNITNARNHAAALDQQVQNLQAELDQELSK
jgi:chromosome segregation ATPase